MTIEAIHNVSALLTPVVLIFGVKVLKEYGVAAWRAGWPSRSREWLVLGITLGFLGKVADNGYWCAAWAAYDSGNPHAPLWLDFGPLANIPFRQLAMIVSSMCHLYGLRLAILESGGDGRWTMLDWSSVIIGISLYATAKMAGMTL